MQEAEGHRDESGKKFAAVCGLYCEACSWFIATREDPERLKRLAAQLHYSEEEGKCYGCRSDKRLPYCGSCKMFACAAERGIDFCSQCEEYPCEDLKQFQSAMPHRIELWANLERVKTIGYKQWLEEMGRTTPARDAKPSIPPTTGDVERAVKSPAATTWPNTAR